MKTGKNVRQSVLATLVALISLAGTAWAMPENPTVVVGGNNINVSDVANIGVNANGLIDWDSFSIGQGEAVKFAFGNGGGWEIINHVTGTQLSEIMGTLSSTGNGHVTLINPNGILVGSAAVIDVGGLTLSTLQVSDDVLINYLNNSENLVFGDANTSSTAELKIENGARINFGEMLELYGGKIQIADGVTISNGSQQRGWGVVTGDDNREDTHLSMAAANKVVPYRLNHDAMEVTAGTGNTLEMGATINNDRHTSLDMDLLGGSVSLNKATINAVANAGQSEITLIAGNSISRKDRQGHGGDTISVAATPANQLTVDGARIKTDDNIHLFAGAVNIKNSTQMNVEAKDDTDYIAALAGNEISFVDDNYNNFSNAIVERGAGNVLNIDSSTMTMTRSSVNENNVPRDFMLGAEEISLTSSDTGHKTTITAAGSMEIDGGQKLTISGAELTGKDVWTHGRTTEIENSTIESQGPISINAFTSKLEDGTTGYTANDAVKVTNSNLSGTGDVEVHAGAISVDNSTVTSDSEVYLVAVNSLVYKDGTKFTADSNNKVTVSNNSTLQVRGGNDEDIIEVRAGALSVDNSRLDAHHIVAEVAKNYQSTKADGEEIGAVQEADIANAINITSSTFETADDIDMQGGSISIADSEFKAPYVDLSAAGKYSYDVQGDTNTIKTVSVADNAVKLNNFVQTVPEGAMHPALRVQAGSITVEGDKAFNPKAAVFLGAGPELTFVRGDTVGFTKMADEQSDLISLSPAAKSSLQDIQSEWGYELTTLSYGSSDKGGGNASTGDNNSGTASAGGSSNSGLGGGSSVTVAPSTPAVISATQSTEAPAVQPVTVAAQTPAPVESLFNGEGIAEVNAILGNGNVGKAQLQEAARIISATPAGQEINRTVHQEVDKAAEPLAVDLRSAADVSQASGAPVVERAGNREEDRNAGVTFNGKPGDARTTENVTKSAGTGTDEVSTSENNEEEQE